MLGTMGTDMGRMRLFPLSGDYGPLMGCLSSAAEDAGTMGLLAGWPHLRVKQSVHGSGDGSTLSQGRKSCPL